jgi:hypothetical protein
VISLSNVVLVECLGVRSLTEEEQLYIRLSRLGQHFSTREEICTFLQSDLNRTLSVAVVTFAFSKHVAFILMHP